MKREDEAILSQTRTISEGESIDWERLRSEIQPDITAGVLAQLKTISSIAQVHRGETRETVEVSGRWRNLELRQVLGKGAFGLVYSAWDDKLQREVALKLTRAADFRTLQEARLLARVRHANVVQVHGVDECEGRVGLWMERIHGKTLETLLQEHGPFSARESAVIGIEVCRAAAAVHRAGLIHRDIKVQNVMREEGGRIVLMDFGLGYATGEERGPHTTVAGTPAYMAPELVRGGDASVSSDIYAIGVLLYRLATASYPVAGRNAEEIRKAWDLGQVQLLRDRRPDLPQKFVSIVERAIAGHPAQRFGTAGAMERVLLDYLAGDEESRSEELRRLRKRRTATVALILILVVAALLWLFVPRHRDSRSVAVLPFANLTADPEMEYLSDGITEELINALARVQGLRVVARSSAFQFKGKTSNMREISERLNVGTVLTGSIRRDGSKLRITAEMFDVPEGYRLWSETYNREADNVSAVQDDIARTICGKLRLQLAGPQLTADPIRQSNPKAFELYLRGRFHWNKRSPEGMRKGLEYFESAVAADPNFALAYSGIADAYSTMVDYGSLPPVEGMQKAKAAALKALALDGSLAEAHASFGLLSSLYDWDWYNAERSLKTALQLNPGLLSAHQWYGVLLMKLGRLPEAMEEAHRALEADPLSVPVNSWLAYLYLYHRDYPHAIEQAQKTLDLDPAYVHVQHALAQAYASMGKRNEALEWCRQAALRSNDAPLTRRYRGVVMAILRMRSEAAEVARSLEADESVTRFRPSYIAAIYAALNDRDKAFEFLNEALELRDTNLPYMIPDPCYDGVRSDARYARVLRRMGIAQQ